MYEKLTGFGDKVYFSCEKFPLARVCLELTLWSVPIHQVAHPFITQEPRSNNPSSTDDNLIYKSVPCPGANPSIVS